MVRNYAKKLLTSFLAACLLCSSGFSVLASTLNTDTSSVVSDTMMDTTDNELADDIAVNQDLENETLNMDASDELNDLENSSDVNAISSDTETSEINASESEDHTVSLQAETPITKEISVFVKGIGIYDDILFKVNSLADYGDANVETSLVSTSIPVENQNTGCFVSLGSVTFQDAGVYEYQISVAPMTGVRESTQSYLYHIELELNDSELIVKEEYYLNEETNEQTDQADFLVVTNQNGSKDNAYLFQAQRTLAGMSLDEKVGQVFMSHYTTTDRLNINTLIDTYHPGSIILFKTDVEGNTPATLLQKLSSLQSRSSVGLMVAVDEEGGRVTRVSSVPGFRTAGAFPPPQDLKVSGDHAASLLKIKADTKEKAELLQSVGFNMNLAPVADVAGPTGYIYARTYGGDGVENATYTEAVVQEAKANGLGTCLKHFPGYGGTSSNTHDGFAINDLSFADFMSNDLLPFASGIAAGTDMVLITHNIINCLDTTNPASLSPAVYSLLKNDMNFNGIVITDDLAMKAITDFVGSDSPSVRALTAGADMVITPNISTEWPKVKAAVENGTLSIDRLNDAVLKILYWKAEHGLLKESPVEAGFYNAAGTKVSEGTFDAMWNQAVAAKTGTVRLYKDLRRSTSVSTGTANITLDLYGYSITNSGGAGTDLFWVNTGGNFKLTDTFGTLKKETKEMSGRLHQYSYNNGVLLFGVKGDTTYETVDFAQSSVGRIVCSGSNRAIVMNGGDMTFENGIISNGYDGVVTYSTKNSASGGTFWMTGGAFLDNTSSWNGGVFNFPAGSNNSKIRLFGGYLVNNTAKNNGGAVFTNGYVYAYGDVKILGNTAKNGGGLCSTFGGNIITHGHACIAYNKASNIGGALYSSAAYGFVLYIHDNATVVCNSASVGGACTLKSDIHYVTGSVRIFDNQASEGPDCYMQENSYFSLTNINDPSISGLNKDAKIGISHPNIPTFNSIQIVQPYLDSDGSEKGSLNPASKWPDYILDCFICNDSDYLAEYHYHNQVNEEINEHPIIGIWLTRSTVSELSWGLYLDEAFQEATSYVRYSSNNNRIVFTRIVKTLQKYGFDPEKVSTMDATYFGFKDSSNQVHIYDGSVSYDGDYKLILDTNDDLSEYQMIYFGKYMEPGIYPLDDIQVNGTFRSVDVHDVYATIWSLDTSDTSFQYVPDGSSLSLHLHDYGNSWEWTDRKSNNSQYDITFTKQNSEVIADISNIHSSVVISNGQSDDVMYKAQYYAYVDLIDLSDVNDTNKMPVIDTSGGKLPENSNNQVIRYLTVNGSDSNRVLRNRRLYQMYTDNRYIYSLNPKLAQIDRMDDDPGYELSAIWVLKDGHSPISLDASDFDVYKLSDFPSMTSLHQLHLTTRPEKVSDDTILVKSNTVIRFVYEPVKSTQTTKTNFYDYDITDGQLYGSKTDSSSTVVPSSLTAYPTSKQDEVAAAYTNTQQQGINSPSNYHGTGSKLAFGNANTGTTLQDTTWNNIKLNQYNRNPSVYRGCAFGLVDGILGNEITGFYPSYSPGIVAPYLFNQGSAIGKTVYRDVDLSYTKSGDSYTLTGVGTTKAQNLDRFNHPSTGSTTYTNIWTNNFWPMDDFSSWGTDGHDIKWGDYTKATKRYYFNKDVFPTTNVASAASRFANSDDGMDHNAFFGMNFSIDFMLPAGYTGPLDYAFFGDDDMWAFLDDQLIIDIGGVHSSVGEYANLWDYLDESSTEDTKHRLTIFYTERGASGSTCWMTFNLPQVGFSGETQEEDEGSLELTKEATGMADKDTFYEFDVELFDENGNVPKDDFSYKRLDPDGNIFGYGLIENGKGSFSIRSGGKLVIPYLKEGIHYRITERTYDCITTFSSRLQDVETESTGVTTEGVVEKQQTIYVKCKNSFPSGNSMPDAGSNELIGFLSAGLWAILFGVPILMILYQYERKRQKRF